MRLRTALGSVGALLGSLAATLVLGAPAAQADTVDPGSAPPIRFISFNMCGSGTMCEWAAGYTNQAKYDAVLKETEAADPGTATGWNADQIFLQEICRYQYDTLAAKLSPKGFSGHYVTTENFGVTPEGQCKKPASDTVSIQGPASVGDYGMAVFVKGDALAHADLELGTYHEGKADEEAIKSPCLKAYTQGRPTWACSVHLDWDSATHAGREQQARKLAQQADLWQAQGVPVSLGGDFNATPGPASVEKCEPVPLKGWGMICTGNAVTAAFYEPAVGNRLGYGNGAFLEVDETDKESFSIQDFPTDCLARGATRCRSGAPTFGQTARKLDYVFLSSRHFKDVKADALPRVSNATDHNMVRGAAAWADCGTECATDGLFRRDTNGVLRRYAGRANGTLSGSTEVGVGWGSMSNITRDGTTLVASDTDGKLWRYPAAVTAADPVTDTYSGSTRIPAGTGGWQAMDVLLAPGDFDGDGKTDLIAREKSTGVLWLYPGNGADGYGTRKSIGTGWGMFDVLLAPGDFNGDGKADLIGRTPSGDLWFYKGDGAGSYAPRVQIGVDWERYSALAAPGDINGDGKADLIGRDGVNDLYLYKGNGAGSYAPAVKVGYDYPDGELLF
ncbi:FG-GAP repeat domain-containing protein [Streptomyces sp. NRRL F-5727]|uniref:FG-GAP repeat domain-containing protein n=1 Tax=Streptomyces sp. NRRL F-5727 TaxID=1463871 RepID=UPI0005658DA3|nr:VCBS repeat-containing protein [Streptomyces sp. NRRL F-5727]